MQGDLLVPFILIAVLYFFIGCLIGYRTAKRKVKRPNLRVIQGGKKKFDNPFKF